MTRWHIGHKNGEYGILPLNRECTRMMGSRLEQTIRMMRVGLTNHPTLQELYYPTASVHTLVENENDASPSHMSAPRNGNKIFWMKIEDSHSSSHSSSDNYSGDPLRMATEAARTLQNQSMRRRISEVTTPPIVYHASKWNREQLTRTNNDDELFDLAERLQRRHMQLATDPTSALDTRAPTISGLPYFVLPPMDQGGVLDIPKKKGKRAITGLQAAKRHRRRRRLPIWTWITAWR